MFFHAKLRAYFPVQEVSSERNVATERQRDSERARLINIVRTQLSLILCVFLCSFRLLQPEQFHLGQGSTPRPRPMTHIAYSPLFNKIHKSSHISKKIIFPYFRSIHFFLS